MKDELQQLPGSGAAVRGADREPRSGVARVVEVERTDSAASLMSYSILDLVPVTEGSDARRSFSNMIELARIAERLGYRRYWLAEHHNMPGIASAATAVLIGHVAGATATIRVGAGGIMLPNHAPLQVAEQFGTLASLYPGRIDLGLGRAPGTDAAATRALRRYYAAAEEFPADVIELLQYFELAQPDQPVRAVPGAGVEVEAWILGSSLFGAQLAARLGLPYAFASRDAGAQRGRGRQRCAGAAPLHVATARLHQPAARPAGTRAAAGRRHHRREYAGGPGRCRPGARLCADWRTGDGRAWNRGVHRPASTG